MKRDMDLVRQILFAIEKRSQEEDDVEIIVDGYTTSEINYHLVILADAGLITAKYQKNLRDDYIWQSIRLTWEGHEFLDAARDNTRWEKAKIVMTHMGGFALDVMKQLLIQYIKQDLNLT